jgi:hypothetical protein
LKKEQAFNDNQIREWTKAVESAEKEIQELNKKVVKSPQKLKEVIVIL